MKNISKICIVCPAGCHLEIAVDSENHASVSGNRCPRGISYAVSELTDPRRVVTAVVPTDDPYHCVLPVRSALPFPKGKIAALLNLLYTMRVSTPVSCGDVILKDALETGIDIIAAENRD